MDLKTKSQNIETNASSRDVNQIIKETQNIYESLNIVSKRANQISQAIKRELSSKLEEFSSGIDSLEEMHENKEQIEISKFYEKLPSPSLIAMHEYLGDELTYRYKEPKKPIITE
jgi:DNA-directed RNA polymerase subunit K/omega